MPGVVAETNSAHWEFGRRRHSRNETGREGSWARTNPNSQSQPIDFQRVTFDDFDSAPENEPDSGSKPHFQHLEKWAAAFWRNHKKNRRRWLAREDIALAQE